MAHVQILHKTGSGDLKQTLLDQKSSFEDLLCVLYENSDQDRGKVQVVMPGDRPVHLLDQSLGAYGLGHGLMYAVKEGEMMGGHLSGGMQKSTPSAQSRSGDDTEPTERPPPSTQSSRDSFDTEATPPSGLETNATTDMKPSGVAEGGKSPDTLLEALRKWLNVHPNKVREKELPARWSLIVDHHVSGSDLS